MRYGCALSASFQARLPPTSAPLRAHVPQGCSASAYVWGGDEKGHADLGSDAADAAAASKQRCSQLLRLDVSVPNDAGGQAKAAGAPSGAPPAAAKANSPARRNRLDEELDRLFSRERRGREGGGGHAEAASTGEGVACKERETAPAAALSAASAAEKEDARAGRRSCALRPSWMPACATALQCRARSVMNIIQANADLAATADADLLQRRGGPAAAARRTYAEMAAPPVDRGQAGVLQQLPTAVAAQPKANAPPTPAPSAPAPSAPAPSAPAPSASAFSPALQGSFPHWTRRSSTPPRPSSCVRQSRRSGLPPVADPAKHGELPSLPPFQ